MRNSDRYLAIFSDVEKWLRLRTVESDRPSFYQLVERAAGTDRTVARYKNDLKEFADLRNAIAHERTDDHIIAEPNERALADFARIRDALMHPPRVNPTFQRSVVSRADADSVGIAVTDMREGSFSQVPVVKNGTVTAVLTAETITRWLASEVHNDLVSLMDTPIREILGHVEKPDHYAFLSRNASLHDALQSFEDFASEGKDLDAILVTENGAPDQKLLGILTVYDLPRILELLGLRRVAAA